MIYLFRYRPIDQDRTVFYFKRVFDTAIENGDVVLRCFSPDMEEGYPVNLRLEIRYRLWEDNALEITYSATTDAPTVINLSNHCYFNLNGLDGSTILDHHLWLNSSCYTEYDEVFAQTGRRVPVDNTPLDFRTEHTLFIAIPDRAEKTVSAIQKTAAFAWKRSIFPIRSIIRIFLPPCSDRARFTDKRRSIGSKP